MFSIEKDFNIIADNIHNKLDAIRIARIFAPCYILENTKRIYTYSKKNALIEYIAQILSSNGEVRHGRVTICYLNRGYQVDSDDGRYLYSAFFKDINNAIEKYIDICIELNLC